MTNEDTRSFEESQEDTARAYKKAGNIFSFSAYILLAVYFIGIAAELGLIYKSGRLELETAKAVLLQNRTYVVVLFAIIFGALASSIKEKSFTAIKYGRVVACFMLLGVPVFTVLGIIALGRLFDKDL